MLIFVLQSTKFTMSSKINLRKGQIQLIEKLAVVIEKGGLQPAMAKIIAFLMVSDEPELTFDEIWGTLGISKSAASQAINQLLAINKLEYRTKLGDRKRYFCSRVTSWQEDTKSQIEGLSVFTNVLKQILDQRPAKTKDFNNSLKKLINFMEFLTKEMPALYKKFEAQ